MSLSYVPLKTVLVRDNRTILDNERQFAIVKSCKEIKYKQWTSNSVSTGSIQWTVPPPADRFIIDRRIKMQLPIRLVLTGVVQPGQYLLNANYDAPRQFPIQSCINTISLSINNYTITQNFGEYIHALLCFNTNKELFSRDYSLSPSCPDSSQSYLDLVNTISNPLSMAGDSNFEDVVGRGGYGGYNVSLNPKNTLSTPATLTGYVDLLVTEELFMSPLYWGAFAQIGAGFINVTSMDLTVNFYTLGANRLWSHAPDPNISILTNNTAQMYFKDFPTSDPNNSANPSIPFFYGTAQPLLFIHYLTPLDSLLISNHTPITYPYFTITKYPTDWPALEFGKTAIVQSNNIQLSNIPRRLYIYCRPTNNDYFSNPSMTDCFYKISGLTIQFNNRLLLSEASIEDLYEISRKNHLNMDYSNFAGLPLYKVGGLGFDNTNQYYGRGTILCFEPATDWGLYDDEVSGTGGQYNFQISNMSVTNINNSGAWDALPFTIYILAIAEGSFTIPESGQATADLSIVTHMDALNAVEDYQNHTSYNETQLINGGNFFTNFKKGLHDTKEYLKREKPISHFLTGVAESEEDLPYAVGREASRQLGITAKNLGYGKSMYGGELMDPIGINALGGKRMHHNDLYSRLKHRR